MAFSLELANTTFTSLPFGDFILQAEKHRNGWLSAQAYLKGLFSNVSHDLAHLEKPEIQQVLHQLGVTPKTRQWLLDPVLKKRSLNHLLTHAILTDSIDQFFLGLKKAFWKKIKNCALARQHGYMRLKKRMLLALYAYNNEISLIFWNEKENALKILKEYYQGVQSLQEQYDDLFHHRLWIIDQAALDFLHFVRNESPLLQEVFESTSDDKVQEFFKVYLVKRAKHQMRKENLQEQLAQQKETLQEDHPQIKSTQEHLQEERNYLKKLILRAAKKCSLNDAVRQNMKLQRKEINQTIKDRFSPVIRHVMACDYELSLNRSRSAFMVGEMESLKSYIPNYTSENGKTLSDILQPNTLLKNISSEPYAMRLKI